MHSDLYKAAVTSLSDLSKIWDPFIVVDMKGLDGLTVFAHILPGVEKLGLGMLLLMALLRSIHLLSSVLAGGDESILGMAVEVALISGILGGYSEWIRLAPSFFTGLGNSIMVASVADLSGQVSGAFEAIGNERHSDFLLWSANAFSLGVMSLIAALLSSAAVVLLFVVAKLQGYLFTFFFLLGPLLIPTLLYSPLRHIGRNYFTSYLGVSIMGLVGPIFFAILCKSRLLSHAFAAGTMGDAVTSCIFSILTILMMVLVPVLSFRIFGAPSHRMFGFMKGAGFALGAATSGAHSVYANAKGTASSFKGRVGA